jgi:hypothetical protein
VVSGTEISSAMTPTSVAITGSAMSSLLIASVTGTSVVCSTSSSGNVAPT